MIRTLISLTEKDKRWLDSYSARHGQSAAETVRKAIRSLRNTDAESQKAEILRLTGGLWDGREGDALDFVDRIRNEW